MKHSPLLLEALKVVSEQDAERHSDRILNNAMYTPNLLIGGVIRDCFGSEIDSTQNQDSREKRRLLFENIQTIFSAYQKSQSPFHWERDFFYDLRKTISEVVVRMAGPENVIKEMPGMYLTELLARTLIETAKNQIANQRQMSEQRWVQAAKKRKSDQTELDTEIDRDAARINKRIAHELRMAKRDARNESLGIKKEVSLSRSEL